MQLREMYRHITEDTDPNDPVVAEEIKKAMRQSDGMTDIQKHLPILRAHAKGNVLEIGVHWGISTVALILGVEEKGGYVWSVDVNPCRSNIEHPQWTFLLFDSIKDTEYLKHYLPEELDLLFIDGDHSYEAVSSDLRNYGALTRQIILHDTDNPEVSAAVIDYVDLLPGKQVALYTGSHGLARIW